MSRRNYLIFLSILLLGLTVHNVLKRLPKPEHPSANVVTQTSLPVIPTDTQWDDRSESVLRDWEEELEELFDREPSDIPFHVTLEDGEMMISEAVEKEPGVFHFTTLTPTAVEDEETGEELIRIRSERLAVGLDGGVDRLAAPGIIMRSDEVGTVSTWSDQELYRLSISAKRTRNGFELRGNIVEQNR